LLILSLLTILLGFVPIRIGRSTDGENVQWSNPINLSASVTGQASFPVIASDISGGLHVFWRNTDKAGGTGQRLFYTHWDGTVWSAPTDVIMSPGPHPADGLPSVTVSPDNHVHLVWNSWEGIYHSRAYAGRPATAQAWSAPQIIGQGECETPHLVIAPDDSLCVAYFCTGPDGGIFFTRSEDAGTSWGEPQSVWGPFPPQQLPDRSEVVHLAIDSDQVLHVVWVDLISDPSSTYGSGVFYSRSLDFGATWATPWRVDEDWAEMGTPDKPDWFASLSVDQEGVLHVLWSASYQDGPSCARQHRLSRTGGASWTPRRRVLPPLEGCLGWMNMVSDSTGTLHVVTIARNAAGEESTIGLYHSRWTDGSWTPPVLVPGVVGLTEDWREKGLDRPRAVISEGAILNVVWMNYDSGIWFARGEIMDAPKLPVTPLPLPTAPPTERPSPPAVSRTTPTLPPLTPTPAFEASGSPQNGEGSGMPTWWPLLAGTAPVALLLLIVIVLRAKNRSGG
jgi:hypothetical protein